jgi:hypothetical protein
LVHVLLQAGFNAIHLGLMQHSWIKNVEILNADSAIATWQVSRASGAGLN